MELITAVTGVFNELSGWFITALSQFTECFYNSTSNQLTLLGVMALIGLGIAVVRMLFAIVTSFLTLRGGN